MADTHIQLTEHGGKYSVKAAAPDGQTMLKAVTQVVKVTSALCGVSAMDMAALIAAEISKEGEDGTTTDTG